MTNRRIRRRSEKRRRPFHPLFITHDLNTSQLPQMVVAPVANRRLVLLAFTFGFPDFVRNAPSARSGGYLYEIWFGYTRDYPPPFDDWIGVARCPALRVAEGRLGPYPMDSAPTGKQGQGIIGRYAVPAPSLSGKLTFTYLVVH